MILYLGDPLVRTRPNFLCRCRHIRRKHIQIWSKPFLRYELWKSCSFSVFLFFFSRTCKKTAIKHKRIIGSPSYVAPIQDASWFKLYVNNFSQKMTPYVVAHTYRADHLRIISSWKLAGIQKKLINMWPNFGKPTIILEFSSLTWYCLKQRMLFKYFLGSSTNFYL